MPNLLKTSLTRHIEAMCVFLFSFLLLPFILYDLLELNYKDYIHNIK